VDSEQVPTLTNIGAACPDHLVHTKMLPLFIPYELGSDSIEDLRERTERADAYGIAPEDLDEHHRKRTVLGVNVLPEDIAQAVMHFASAARSGKSTGNLLNVDGGVDAAFPR